MTLKDLVTNWRDYLMDEFGDRIADEDGETWEDLEYFISRLVSVAQALEREKVKDEMSKKLLNTKNI